MERCAEQWKKGMSVGLLAGCLVLGAVLFRAYLDGKFDSAETLQQYIAGFGLLAPLILAFIQAAQVVLPVLPGFFGCIAGLCCLDGRAVFGAITLESPQGR